MARTTRHAVSPIEDPVLAEILRRLVCVYSPVSVYLFGSSARGERSEDSDYDLLLVIPDGSPQELRRAAKGYEALWGVGAPVDIVVWALTDFQERLHLQASLPATVVREGVLLHVAA